MSTLRWRAIPYERALPRPIQTAHGSYETRAGFLVQVVSDTGEYGLGDVAPLPGFSLETLDEVRRAWDTLTSPLTGVELPARIEALAAAVAELGPLAPSLRFGIETALADLAAHIQGIALAAWLSPKAASRVPVNGLISEQSTDAAVATLRARYRDGYRCFKVKAGVDAVDRDIQRIHALCDAFDDVDIRVDVNGGWREDQLRAASAALADVKLEFIEQPLPVGQAESARAVTREFGIRLALDEDIATVDAGLQMLQSDLCDVIVVKPMMVGGLTGAWRLARVAADFSKEVVFTTAWESDVGVTATLHLCAACGLDAGTAGLSTAGMIADGLVQPALQIVNAGLDIPDRSGLGLSLVDGV